MKLITLLPSLMADSCPPMELTVGNVIGKTVDVPYIGQFCQYVAIPYAEPLERWRPSVKKRSSVTRNGAINSLEKRPPCPDIGKETVPEDCLYFDIYKPIGSSLLNLLQLSRKKWPRWNISTEFLKFSKISNNLGIRSKFCVSCDLEKYLRIWNYPFLYGLVMDENYKSIIEMTPQVSF